MRSKDRVRFYRLALTLLTLEFTLCSIRQLVGYLQ